MTNGQGPMAKQWPMTNDTTKVLIWISSRFLRRRFHLLISENLHRPINRNSHKSRIVALSITVQPLLRFAAKLFHVRTRHVPMKRRHALNSRLGRGGAGLSHMLVNQIALGSNGGPFVVSEQPKQRQKNRHHRDHKNDRGNPQRASVDVRRLVANVRWRRGMDRLGMHSLSPPPARYRSPGTAPFFAA